MSELDDRDRRTITVLAAEFQPEAAALRRRLHEVAEPAFAEHRTAGLVAEALARAGLDVRTGVGGTGVVADYDTGRPGPCVALRADLDALPVEDLAGGAAASSGGYAHCCGHDGHLAAVITAGRILIGLGDRFVGRARLIFQPAEEQAAGARAMIDAGVLADPPVAAIFGLHSWPGLPVGHVACRSGPMMAACDRFGVRLAGRGGHGARPGETKNPVAALAAVLATLGRLNRPGRVVTVGRVRAGHSANVIPDRAELAGTLRTLGAEARRRSRREVLGAVEAACAALGIEVAVAFDAGCPQVAIDAAMYEWYRQAAASVLGPGRTVWLEAPSMGSEDFGLYLAHCPGLMFRLGVGVDRPPLHNAAFEFNDQALPAGAALLAGLALLWAERPVPTGGPLAGITRGADRP